MNKLSIRTTRSAIVLGGIAVLGLMLWEPQLEGRNAHATFFRIYFHDPFLAYAYVASIAFFVALYQAYRITGYIETGKPFSHSMVQAVRGIKVCALFLVVCLLGAEVYFLVIQRHKEDIAGGVMMGLFLILVSVIVATVAAFFEHRIRTAIEMKTGNA